MSKSNELMLAVKNQSSSIFYNVWATFVAFLAYLMPVIVCAVILLCFQARRIYEEEKAARIAKPKIKMVMLPPREGAEPVMRAATFILRSYNFKEVIHSVPLHLNFSYLDNVDYFVLSKLQEMNDINTDEEIYEDTYVPDVEAK